MRSPSGSVVWFGAGIVDPLSPESEPIVFTASASMASRMTCASTATRVARGLTLAECGDRARGTRTRRTEPGWVKPIPSRVHRSSAVSADRHAPRTRHTRLPSSLLRPLGRDPMASTQDSERAGHRRQDRCRDGSDQAQRVRSRVRRWKYLTARPPAAVAVIKGQLNLDAGGHENWMGPGRLRRAWSAPRHPELGPHVALGGHPRRC